MSTSEISKCHKKEEEDDPVTTLLAIEQHLYNMGKALTCPLCLSTLRNPTLLPCNHAFCKRCITEYFDPKHNRQIDSVSGKHTFKNYCPICKTPASKRGITESEMLVGLVRAYKRSLRSFGQTPVIYDANIAMTQIEDTVCFSHPDDNDDTDDVQDNDIVLVADKKKAPSLRDCHQHLEVSRGVTNILKRAVNTLASSTHDSGSKSSNERIAEIEKQNKLRKLNHLLSDQEKVVQVDEKALVRAAVSKQKRTSDSSSLCLDDRKSIPLDCPPEATFQNETINMTPNEHANDDDDATTMGEDMSAGHEFDFSSTQKIMQQAISAIDKSDAILEVPVILQESENNSQLFFSPSEPENVLESSSRKEIMTTQECYEQAMEDVRENEAADRSCEWLDKENEVLTQDVPSDFDTASNKTKISIKATGNSGDDYRSGNTSTKHSDVIYPNTEKFFSATSQMNDPSQDVSYSYAKMKRSNDKEDLFSVGEMVHVEDRVWSGVNRRGGIARITKVRRESGILYDVAYVLGGREKNVDSAFVHVYNDQMEENPIILSCVPESSSVKSEGSRKSHRVEERKVVERWIAQIDKEEKLKAKEKIAKNSHLTSPSRSENKKDETKKCKPMAVKSPHDESSKSVKLTTISNKLAFSSIIERTLGIFNSALRFDGECAKSRTIYITTSSIGKSGDSLVKQLISESKTGVKLKFLEDFNPFKTNILVTSSSGSSSYGGLISKLRTMKAMRAALASIPIVSLEWVEACLSERQLIPLTIDVTITALPTKLECHLSEVKRVSLGRIRDTVTASLGVLALALLQPGVYEPYPLVLPSILFENKYIFLCGSTWKTSTTKTKDVQLLVREGGGNLIHSAAQTAKFIQEDLLESTAMHLQVILLCDDSSSDSTDGITGGLRDAVHNCVAEKAAKSRNPVIVVNSNWLFDSISCATCLDPTLYEPSSPTSHSLWKMCRPTTD